MVEYEVPIDTLKEIHDKITSDIKAWISSPRIEIMNKIKVFR